MGGGSFRDVAGRFELSKSAVHRHAVSHFAPEVRAALVERTSLGPTQLVLQYLEIVADLEDATDIAKASGSARDIARVADSRARVWAFISQRLGIEEPEIRDDIEAYHALAMSLRQVMHEHPELGLPALIVSELRQRGEKTFSALIEGTFLNQKEIEK